MKDFPIFPWDRDEKPYFVHGEYEWYVDKFVTDKAHKDEYMSGGGTRKGLKDVVAFFVKKKNDDKDVRSVLLNDKQQILFDESNSMTLWNKVDVLKIHYSFMSPHEIFNEKEEQIERDHYFKQIATIID